MKNWLGQDIGPGSIVYRGARDGNSSSFKIGVVDYVTERNSTARVIWKFGPSYWSWLRDKAIAKGLGRQYDDAMKIAKLDSKGSPSLDTLVVVDVDLAELEKAAADWQALRMEING